MTDRLTDLGLLAAPDKWRHFRFAQFPDGTGLVAATCTVSDPAFDAVTP